MNLEKKMLETQIEVIEQKMKGLKKLVEPKESRMSWKKWRYNIKAINFLKLKDLKIAAGLWEEKSFDETTLVGEVKRAYFTRVYSQRNNEQVKEECLDRVFITTYFLWEGIPCRGYPNIQKEMEKYTSGIEIKQVQ